jgi:hypothetical protein
MSRQRFSGGRNRRGPLGLRRTSAIGGLAAGATLVLATSSPANAVSAHRSAHVPSAKTAEPHVTAGKWIQLSSSTTYTVIGGRPTEWVGPNGEATVVFGALYAPNKQTYFAATMSPTGHLLKLTSIFGSTYWPALSNVPTLVSDGNAPLLIFEGGGPVKPYTSDCIVGDLDTSSGWKLQSWSLSGNCNNANNGGASEGPGGSYSAAWPGGWSNGHGVLYRIGVSPTIPAGGPDGEIGVPSDAGVPYASEANDLAGTGDFYAAWAQSSGTAGHGGLRVEDITKHGTVMVVPESGTQSVADFLDLAMTNTNTHGGVWIAYCANVNPCSLRLWRVGAAKPLTIPGGDKAGNVAISAGPDGRLWVAWSLDNWDVSVVRTNKADTAFGPVQTFTTSCGTPGQMALTGGSFGPVDVAMQCQKYAANYGVDYFMQVMVPLSLTPSSPVIKNTQANNVTFKVTDVGDAVVGATVSVAGKTAKTGPSGNATFSFPKGMKAGTYAVTVTSPGYSAAHGSLVVES